ncbi:uncharacterized protein LOC110989936 [Acanthaster planci]|uniref:Uncharacterized protein LOC110989936 n=1 Tax=Acanthaster planci TaxID=133434 RepID=A0A8B7ZXS3_ACAPL|nr:uncharacterized protein LOC110989936 [Acanthaster planci]
MMRGTLVILLALCITAFCCRAIGRRAYLPPSVVPPLCRDEGILAYDGAPPSPFGVELNDSIGHMQDLMDSGCSNKLGRYLCTAHFPRLNLIRQGVDSESVYLRPCAELCRTIWRDCRPTARQLRVERTPEFECNKYFPLMKKWQCLSDLFPPNQPSNWITAVSRHSVEKASVRYLSPASTTQAIRIRFTNDTSSAVEREIFHLVDPEQGPPVRTIEIFPLWNPGSYSIEITALNDFGEGTTTIANIPAYEDAPNDVPDDHGGHCENITVPLCQSDIGYTKTSMPNFLHHQKQDDAGMEVHQFYPLVKVQCSPFIKTFLCSLYTPECTDGASRPLQPCRELCGLAKDGCEELMNNFGFAWPEHLVCENFPSFSEGHECYLGDASVNVTDDTHSVEDVPLCEDITLPLCRDIGYTKTSMPNILGHQTQDEAGLEVHQFFPLVKVQCSPFLKTLLCAVYTPQCTDGEKRPLLPCRELCAQARDGCEELMNDFGFAWPQSLACENFPSFSEGNDCYIGEGGVPQQCEDITVPMCMSDIGYTKTAMPNIFGHQLQDEAGLEIHQFWPLVEIGCSSFLKTLLCAVYTPECTEGSNSPNQPCRELCVPARDGCEGLIRAYGFSWPDSLMCENLPSFAEGNDCFLGGVPVTDTQPHERCQDITVSMCRSDVGYNYTAMPNPIGHQLQSDAELQLQTFVPLMQYGCSPHAGSFLCAMYLPLCDTSSGAQVLPCRELCDSVRRNCSTVLHEFGFSWPESLVCENLPSRNSGSTCYLGGMAKVRG